MRRRNLLPSWLSQTSASIRLWSVRQARANVFWLLGTAEARAAGQVIKDDGTSAQAIADFLQRYQLL